MNEPALIPPPVPQSQNFAIPLAIFGGLFFIALAIYFSNTQKEILVKNNDFPTPEKIDVDAVTSTDHILGNPNAEIIIVEYSDIECPFCKSFHPTMEKIMSTFGNDGQVAWVYRHLPLPKHINAFKEAEATECAAKLGGNTKFWEYLKKLFEMTQSNDGLDLINLPKIAKTIGLDEKLFNECLENGDMKSVVKGHIESGKRAKINGTPTSVILLNKKQVGLINGAQPFEVIKIQIEELLK